MKKEITLEERKQIQLEMLDEIDAFCRKHDIKYSIAFGTLLGAIRHKGFIPWDDDVDIMMPLPDLLKFKQLFKSENLTYVDVDTDTRYGYAFSRIAHNKSYNKDGLISKSYGVCIDVYVMIGIPQITDSFFENLYPLFNKRINAIHWKSKLIKLFPIKTIPFYSKIQRDYRNYLFEKSIPYSKASMFYIIAGPLKLREKMIYDKDVFTNIIDIQFEDRVYKAISDWDYFLTLRYGDYMQLPPVEQRHPYHGGKYYWR